MPRQTSTILICSIVLSLGTLSLVSIAGDTLYYTPISYTVRHYPFSVVAADLDGDGDQDLAVTNRGETSGSPDTTVSILKNSSNSGTFGAKTDYYCGGLPTGLAAAKLLGNDNYIDLIVTNNANSGSVTILKNNGSGGFPAADTQFFPTASIPYGVCVADLDGNGKNDFATAGGYVAGNITVYKDSSGSYGYRSDLHYSGSGYGITAAKLIGGDTLLDLAVVTSPTLTIFKNLGNGTFDTLSSHKVTLHTASGPYDVVAADFDGDGDFDLATANISDTVSVFKNLGSDAFDTTHYVAGDGPYAIVAADIDNDGDKDLVTANQTSGDVSILKNNGSGSFATHQEYWAGGHVLYDVFAFISGDYGGASDSFPDLAITNEDSNTVSILWNLIPYKPCKIRRGDANGDNQITACDSTLLRRYLFASSTCASAGCGISTCFYNNETLRGDWNGDGSITIADLLRCGYYIGENFNPGGRYTPLIRDVASDTACVPLQSQ